MPKYTDWKNIDLQGWEPTGNRLFVIPETEEKTAGGIILPESAQEKSQIGCVIAVGPGKKDEHQKVVPVTIPAGSRVLYGKYSGTKHQLSQDLEIVVIAETDVQALCHPCSKQGTCG